MNKQFDVIIVGAGPAGIAAALAADFAGARTLLVEKSGFVGGMSTDGCMNVFCGESGAKLFGEIMERLVTVVDKRKVYDREELKEFYREKLEASSVELLLHAQLTAAELDGGHIASVTVSGADGPIKLMSKTYIDATGDGTLAYLTGVPCSVGRDGDGNCQPMSLMVRVGGVDPKRAIYPRGGQFAEGEIALKRYVEEGKLDAAVGHIILIPEKHPGFATVNMTNVVGLDGTDPFSRTRAELQARAQLMPLVEFLRKEVPGYENVYLVGSGTYTGVRESRRFHGAYTLTEEDMASGRVFPDWVAAECRFGFDIHNPDGPGFVKTENKVKQPYTIPYGALQPEGVDNLLLSGRCISATHVAHSSCRVMPICMAVGEGAGVAAALCQGNTRNADIAKVQTVLRQYGMKAPE